MKPLLEYNLAEMGPVDIVVVGYVDGLSAFTSDDWQGGDESSLFAWQKIDLPNGEKTAFLGCRVSFWGDIAGNLVRAVHRINRAKCIPYIGKLGSLRPQDEPNKWIAIGNTSNFNGKDVEWNNVLGPFVLYQEHVVWGSHFSLPSVLDEDKVWLEKNKALNDFVDSEIGHMVMGAVDLKIQFRYLHIISDNLAEKYTYDLSNERLNVVLSNRKARAMEIEQVLQRFFDSWGNK